jgi:hypothetical protein
MGKIYKMNKTGTFGVSVNKAMREAGYIPGAIVEWFPLERGFLLTLFKKAPDKPVEPVKAPEPVPVA